MPKIKVQHARTKLLESLGMADLLIVNAKTGSSTKGNKKLRSQVSDRRRMTWMAERIKREIEASSEPVPMKGGTFIVKPHGPNTRLFRISFNAATSIVSGGGDLFRARLESGVLFVEPIKPITPIGPRPRRKGYGPVRKTEQRRG